MSTLNISNSPIIINCPRPNLEVSYIGDKKFLLNITNYPPNMVGYLYLMDSYGAMVIPNLTLPTVGSGQYITSNMITVDITQFIQSGRLQMNQQITFWVQVYNPGCQPTTVYEGNLVQSQFVPIIIPFDGVSSNNCGEYIISLAGHTPGTPLTISYTDCTGHPRTQVVNDDGSNQATIQEMICALDGSIVTNGTSVKTQTISCSF